MPTTANHGPDQHIPLSRLRRGDRATIAGIDGQQSALIARLAARGMTEGVAFRVLKAGDPMLLLVEGSRWAMTRADAEHVQTDPARRPLSRRLLDLLLP